MLIQIEKSDLFSILTAEGLYTYIKSGNFKYLLKCPMNFNKNIYVCLGWAYLSLYTKAGEIRTE